MSSVSILQQFYRLQGVFLARGGKVGERYRKGNLYHPRLAGKIGGWCGLYCDQIMKMFCYAHLFPGHYV